MTDYTLLCMPFARCPHIFFFSSHSQQMLIISPIPHTHCFLRLVLGFLVLGSVLVGVVGTEKVLGSLQCLSRFVSSCLLSLFRSSSLNDLSQNISQCACSSDSLPLPLCAFPFLSPFLKHVLVFLSSDSPLCACWLLVQMHALNSWICCSGSSSFSPSHSFIPVTDNLDI
jgi:hypothetical protein